MDIVVQYYHHSVLIWYINFVTALLYWLCWWSVGVDSVQLISWSPMSQLFLMHLFMCTYMHHVHILQKAATMEVNYLDTHTLCSPLMAAVSYGEVDKVKALLRKRADCNMEDSEGFSALFYAIYAEHKQRVC